jgi:TetR/AcrR family transcriptional regulator
MPESPQRQRRKEARPQELLDAALTLFVEKGFAATRAEEVAALAGVSKGTLYLYYPSKEDLLKAVIRDTLSTSIADGRAVLQEFKGSTEELLRMAVTLWWERVGLTRAGGICKLIVAEARNFPELAEFFSHEVAKPGQDLIQQIIQRGIDRGEFRNTLSADHAATVLIAAMQFKMIHLNSIGACPGCGDIEPHRFIETLTDLMINGLNAKPDTPRTPA